jgi:hypothetical protein
LTSREKIFKITLDSLATKVKMNLQKFPYFLCKIKWQINNISVLAVIALRKAYGYFRLMVSDIFFKKWCGLYHFLKGFSNKFRTFFRANLP